MASACGPVLTFLADLGGIFRRLGFGTYLAAGGDVRNGVRAALKAGIRAIDTATLYRVHHGDIHNLKHICLLCCGCISHQPCMIAMQNEADIARAMHEAGVDRKDVFITSKVAPFQVWGQTC